IASDYIICLPFRWVTDGGAEAQGIVTRTGGDGAGCVRRARTPAPLRLERSDLAQYSPVPDADAAGRRNARRSAAGAAGRGGARPPFFLLYSTPHFLRRTCLCLIMLKKKK